MNVGSVEIHSLNQHVSQYKIHGLCGYQFKVTVGIYSGVTSSFCSPGAFGNLVDAGGKPECVSCLPKIASRALLFGINNRLLP